VVEEPWLLSNPMKKKLGDSPAIFLINRGVMATLQERRLGYHSRAGLEPGTNGFSTLRINHYAARGIPRRPCKHQPGWLVRHAYAMQVAAAVMSRRSMKTLVSLLTMALDGARAPRVSAAGTPARRSERRMGAS
jgi:hypothetical protein